MFYALMYIFYPASTLKYVTFCLVYYVYMYIYLLYGGSQGRLAIVAKRATLFKFCINKIDK